MQKMKLQQSSSVAAETRRSLDVPIYDGGATSQMGAPVYNSSVESSRRAGIPPSHPINPQVLMASRASMNANSNSNGRPSSSHYRSLSQPCVFDMLPPLSPTNPLIYHREAAPPVVVGADQSLTNVSVEEKAGNSVGLSAPPPVVGSRVGVSMVGENLPPRKGHRRSISDTPLGFSAMIQSSPQLIPIGNKGLLDGGASGSQKPIQLLKQESKWNDKSGRDDVEGRGERKSEGDFVDDLISAYMNLDNIDTLNSSGTEEKDMDSRASGTKTTGGESSDNEVESGVNRNSMGMHGIGSSVLSDRREGVKRSADGEIAPAARHYRSVSMESYMESLDFDDDAAREALQTQADQLSPESPINEKLAKVNIELNGEFSEAELKKIVGNVKLAEIALSDPRRAKRILANRQSAARSKERKMRYIAELEQKVQTLLTETTTLSAQFTTLQRESTGVTSQNKELKFRLQAMDQQAQLKDALNEALAADLQRLKAEMSGATHLSNCMAQQLSINNPNPNQILQFQHQQANPLNIYQLQQQQQQQQQQPPQPNQLQPQPQNGEAATSQS